MLEQKKGWTSPLPFDTKIKHLCVLARYQPVPNMRPKHRGCPTAALDTNTPTHPPLKMLKCLRRSSPNFALKAPQFFFFKNPTYVCSQRSVRQGDHFEVCMLGYQPPPPPPLFQGAKMLRGCRCAGLHLGTARVPKSVDFGLDGHLCSLFLTFLLRNH